MIRNWLRARRLWPPETERYARLPPPEFCRHGSVIARPGREDVPCLALEIDAARAAGGHGIDISVVRDEATGFDQSNLK